MTLKQRGGPGLKQVTLDRFSQTSWKFQSTAPGFSVSAGLLRLLVLTGVVFGPGWFRLR